MGETFLDRHGIKSGIKLNDVIEDFKYVYKGQEVKAGDFVNYINGIASKTDYGESVDTAISTQQNSGYIISAVQLDENRVFIAHSYGSNYQLYGIVCTINGATIAYGTDTELSIDNGTGDVISICLLPNGNVFVSYRNGLNYIRGMVCTINGATITKGTDTVIVNAANVGIAFSVCLLSNGNVFIAHNYGSNHYLYGIVVNISGTTITVGADKSLVNSSYAGYKTSTCLLPNGNVFIAHSYGSDYYLYGIVVSIDGTTITKGSDTQLDNFDYSGQSISVELLPNGNVFIAHKRLGEAYLYGMICTISGTTIAVSTNTQLGTESAIGYYIATQLLENGDVFIAHGHTANFYKLYGMIAKINGTTITAGTDVEFSSVQYTGYAISPVLLRNGTIFIAHSYTTNCLLNAQIFAIDNNMPTNNIVIPEYEQQVTPATEPPFNAISLSSGTGGTDTEHNEQVKIARPNVEVI